MHQTLFLVSLALSGVAWTQTPTTVAPCTMCTFVVSQAAAHYRKGDTEKDVAKELHEDCKSLERFYGKQSVKDCQEWAKANIDTIYADFKAGKNQNDICTDIGQCASLTTTPVTTTTVNYCTLCISVIDQARNDCNNTFTNEYALAQELGSICHFMRDTYGQQVHDWCMNLFPNLDQWLIYNDLVAGKTSPQVCQDMQQCP